MLWLALAYPGTTPDYWMNADDELVATAVAVLDELHDRRKPR